MDESIKEWFIREVLVHEPALVRFMTRVWPDSSEVDDLCHDIYVKVYESAAKQLPSSPKAFLFATARHLMADRVRRRRIVSIEMKGDLDSLNLLIDDVTPEQQVNASQDLWRLAEAFSAMPESCRDVLWLWKVEELTRREIGARLGLTPKAVEHRIATGVRFLEKIYFGGKRVSVEDAYRYDGRTAEADHGKS